MYTTCLNMSYTFAGADDIERLVRSCKHGIACAVFYELMNFLCHIIYAVLFHCLFVIDTAFPVFQLLKKEREKINC